MSAGDMFDSIYQAFVRCTRTTEMGESLRNYNLFCLQKDIKEIIMIIIKNELISLKLEESDSDY